MQPVGRMLARCLELELEPELEPGGGMCSPAASAPSTVAGRMRWITAVLSVVGLTAILSAEGNNKQCLDKQWRTVGLCRKLEDCHLRRELARGRQPEKCPGSKNPTICCPYTEGDVTYEEPKGKSCFNNKYRLRGTCLPLKDCKSAKQDDKQGNQPQRCDSGVCCVPSVLECSGGFDNLPKCDCVDYGAMLHNKTRISSIAKKKCREYGRFVCPRTEWSHDKDGILKGYMGDHCFRHVVSYTKYFTPGKGHANFTVVAPAGGEIVNDPQEFPHMALLGYGDRSSISYRCGGTLISPDFILTAAHCGTVQWALLGTLNRSSVVTKPDPVEVYAAKYPQLVLVKQVIQHPEYRENSHYHDIALLRLNKPAQMTALTRPACLHVPGEKAAKEVLGAGWGYTGDGEELPSEVLIKVNLTIQPLKKCRDIGDNRRLPNGLVDSMLCAGGEGIRDTCPGDSGGPLMVRKPDVDSYCMHTVVGVVSFGPLTCGTGLPAVYTKVASYVTWIEGVVWPAIPALSQSAPIFSPK